MTTSGSIVSQSSGPDSEPPRAVHRCLLIGRSDRRQRAPFAFGRLRLGGQVVHLTGLLVDGARDDGMTIRTSLTRTDSGAGACEFMLVQHVEIL